MKLYAKLLAWFLLAAAVSVVVAVLVSSRFWTRSYSDADATRDGQAAVQVYESQGAEGLERWLAQRRREGIFGMLMDQNGMPLIRPGLPRGAGVFLRHRIGPQADGSEPRAEFHFGIVAPPPDEDGPPVRFEMPLPPPSDEGALDDRVRLLDPGPGLRFAVRDEARLRATRITSSSGRQYSWNAVSGPPRGRDAHRRELLLHTLSGLLVIAAVALLSARRITRPIAALRDATLSLAGGNLGTRVPDPIARRGDEIGDLGRSFNDMAGHVQRLIESQRQLLRDVSHELRSPLARLRIAGELARGDPQSAHFDRIEQEAGRLDELIAQVLLVARLDSPVAGTIRQSIDVTALARDVCDAVRIEASRRNVEIVATLSDGCAVSGQPELLESAIENVVRNAVRYTAQGTRIDVVAACDAERWRIAVSDHGPGVPEDQLAAIFEPFHRVSAARERDSGGYGLGLAIAKRAIVAHGGTITACTLVHGGLRVDITLPLYSPIQTNTNR